MATHDGSATDAPASPKILFLTREPIVHQHGGSTTYALSLLRLLTALGARVTVVVTLAESRSAKPWFFLKTPFPEDIDWRIPGYVRLGNLCVRVWSIRAWGRWLLRGAERRTWLRPLASLAKVLFGDSICAYAWDLTPPTPGERRLLSASLKELRPDTVLANYAYWGGALAEIQPNAGRPRRVILMHDLLSARVRSFEAAGRPLDCPRIDDATEMAWLNGAEFLLAAQAREAEAIAPRVLGRVLVLPVTMTARPAAPNPVPGRCVFVASRIAPNESALAWMLEEVWPRVLAQAAGATFAVVGSIAQAVPQPVPAGVVVVGPVPSLEAEYDRASVCLVPLRIGSGIKIKLLEGLSFGKAIVSTPVGVEGLEEAVAGTVLVEQDAEAYAAAIVRLLADDAQRRALEARAYALAQQQFDPRRQLDPEFLEALL